MEDISVLMMRDVSSLMSPLYVKTLLPFNPALPIGGQLWYRYGLLEKGGRFHQLQIVQGTARDLWAGCLAKFSQLSIQLVKVMKTSIQFSWRASCCRLLEVVSKHGWFLNNGCNLLESICRREKEWRMGELREFKGWQNIVESVSNSWVQSRGMMPQKGTYSSVPSSFGAPTFRQIQMSQVRIDSCGQLWNFG